MSWFQGVDKTWYNGEHVARLKVQQLNRGYAVYADGSNILSHSYKNESEAQADLDAFVSALLVGHKHPGYWLEKAKEAKQDFTPTVPPNPTVFGGVFPRSNSGS